MMKHLLPLLVLLFSAIWGICQPSVKTIYNVPEKNYTYFVKHAPDSKGYLIGHMNSNRQFFLTKIRYNGSKIWSKPVNLSEKIKFDLASAPAGGGLPQMRSVVSDFVHCYNEEVFLFESVKEGKDFVLVLHKFDKAGNYVVKAKRMVSYMQSFFEKTPYVWVPYLSGSNFSSLFRNYSYDGSKMLIYTMGKSKEDQTLDRYHTITFDFESGETKESYIEMTNELQYAKFYGNQRAAYGIIDNAGVVYFLEKVSRNQTRVVGVENSVNDFDFKISRYDGSAEVQEMVFSFEGAKWIPDLMIGIDEYGFIHAAGNYSTIKDGLGGYVYAKLIAANLQVVAKNQVAYTNSVSELNQDIPDFQRDNDAKGNRFRFVLNEGLMDGDAGIYLINEEAFSHTTNNNVASALLNTYPRVAITAIDIEGNLRWAKLIDKRPDKPADVPAGSKRGAVSRTDIIWLCQANIYKDQLWINYLETRTTMKSENLGYTIAMGLGQGESPNRTEVPHTSDANKVMSSLELSHVDESGLHYIYSTFTSSGFTYRDFKVVSVSF